MPGNNQFRLKIFWESIGAVVGNTGNFFKCSQYFPVSAVDDIAILNIKCG